MKRGQWLTSGFLLLTSAVAAMAQPPIAVPVNPTNGEPEARQPMAPPISLAELEKFIGGRTTLTLKLKDATIEEVADAMSESSGLDITVRPTPTPFRSNSPSIPPLIPTDRPDGPPPTYTPPPPPRFTLEAKEQPFWEALFAWKGAARAADVAALKEAAATPPVVSPDGRSVRQYAKRTPTVSVEGQPGQNGLWLSPNSRLPNGRQISTWPMVMVATGIQRSQSGLFDPDPFTRQNFVPPALANAPADGNRTRAMDDEAVSWSDRLSVSLSAFFDPKLKPQSMQYEVEEAIDDRGNDLRPQLQSNRVGINSSGFSYGPSYFSSSVSINLEARPAMGKQLKKLRGVLHFIVPVRHEKWEISDVKTPTQRNLSRSDGLYQIQFAGLQKATNGWTAKFIVEAQGEKAKQLSGNRWPGFLWESGGNFTARYVGSWGGGQQDFGLQGMSLVDDQGRTFIASGSGVSARAEGRVEVPKPNVSPPTPRTEKYAYRAEQTVTFSSATDANGQPVFGAPTGAGAANGEMGMPVKLIINIPVERREVSVPFEFTDLPLPPS